MGNGSIYIPTTYTHHHDNYESVATGALCNYSYIHDCTNTNTTNSIFYGAPLLGLINLGSRGLLLV